ncbi:GGDEF domain-containing response regulator [Leptothoe kymatousa]|uniref:Diguanylate cyclase n=1 Tax=Leptothoe kymatousa TAU-MAC 1615 TaxID=2364775 RepID=A0ABS5Y5B0_9CYAN|nr:diguanylate cyclase [Leptothoe kymatousa]MBT9312966.1 diguanylate cyclase [Leptothoe kymatousa TAU-MAC 1615]
MGESLHPHVYPCPSLLAEHCGQACAKNILLIADNLGDAISIREMLGACEGMSVFNLVHAESLAMGLQCLQQNGFDVVLLDLELPDSQGIETLVRMQQSFANIPTVVLTEFADEKFAVQLIRQGAQAFLVKGNINSSWLKSALTVSVTKFECVAQQQQQQQRLEQSNQDLHRQMTVCVDELHRLRQELKTLSTLAATDSLTGIANRYGFEQCLEREWDHAYRSQRSLALIMLDLDYFKQFNDGYGHIQGDSCLRQVAQTLQSHLENFQGMVARYGGEEFVAILPDTSVQSAVQVAETLRISIQALAIRHPNSAISRWVTASLGVAAAVPTAKDVAADLVHEADQALYCSKKQGRDRIVYFQSPKVFHEPLFLKQ